MRSKLTKLLSRVQTSVSSANMMRSSKRRVSALIPLEQHFPAVGQATLALQQYEKRQRVRAQITSRSMENTIENMSCLGCGGMASLSDDLSGLDKMFPGIINEAFLYEMDDKTIANISFGLPCLQSCVAISSGLVHSKSIPNGLSSIMHQSSCPLISVLLLQSAFLQHNSLT